MAKKAEGDGKSEAASGKPASIADMVRKAIESLGFNAKPDAYQTFISTEFGREVSKSQISQYKSIEKRRQGVAKKKTRSGTVASSAAGVGEASLDDILEFVAEIRSWESVIGPAKIREVVSALYKKA